MANLNDVFVVGGLPSITYHPRPNLHLEQAIKNYLQRPFKILSVSGSTKFGKTVLVKKVLPSPQACWVSGGQVDRPETFWQIINQQMEGFTSLTKVTENAEGETSGREMLASAKPLGLGGTAKSQFSEKKETRTVISTGRTDTPSVVAIQQLMEHKTPLVIDDFHHVQNDCQRLILRCLKDPVFSGLPVVLISVPHRSYDAVRVERELSARIEPLPIPLWDADELSEIAKRGFEALNLHVLPEVIDRLSVQSFGSPHLIQEFCARLCRLEGINETQISTTYLAPPKDWTAFFRNIAEETGRVAFERILKGPRSRTQNCQTLILRNGDKCDVFKALLIAIAATGPRHQLTYKEIISCLTLKIGDALPQPDEVDSALTCLSQLAQEEASGDPVFEWRSEDSELFISDPFFAFYLRWHFGIVF